MVGRGRGLSSQNNSGYLRNPPPHHHHRQHYHHHDPTPPPPSSSRWSRERVTSPPPSRQNFSESNEPPIGRVRDLGRGLGRGRGRGRGVVMDNRPAWMTQQLPNNNNNKQISSSSMHDGTTDVENKRDIGNGSRNSSRDDSSERHKKNSRISKHETQWSSSSFKSDEHLKARKKKTHVSKQNEHRHKQLHQRNHDDIDIIPIINQTKEDEEMKKIILLNQNQSSDNDNLFQFFNNDEGNDEKRESERARKRRERRKRAASNQQENKSDKQLDGKKEIHHELNIIKKSHDSDTQSNVANQTSSGEQIEFGEKDAYESCVDTDRREEEKEDTKSEDPPNAEEDDFDMFNDEIVTPPIVTIPPNSNIFTTTDTDTAIRNEDYDDVEGYYKSTIGEIISFPNTNVKSQSYKVLGTLGKGVFSSVLKCVSTYDDNNIIAIKLIRNNETMAKAAQKELRILRLLQSNKKQESNYNHYIVKLIDMQITDSDFSNTSGSSSFYPSMAATTTSPPLEYRNHTALLFEHLPHNLRQILNRFGSGVGINLQAVRSYARQLLSALRHLSRNHIVHADIKPENILVSTDYSMVKLADFGSAFFISDIDARSDNPTPYLVSRFYRPPEVILGLEYNHPSVDLWSVGVTLAELFTGSVLFPGHSNNAMLHLFMECMGSFSNKMIKRHIRSYEERLQLRPFFDRDSYAFHRQSIDKVTKRPVVKIVRVIQPVQGRQLSNILLKSCGAGSKEQRGEILKFADLLSKCLALDPTRRVSIEDGCKHDFFGKPIVAEKKRKREDAIQTA